MNLHKDFKMLKQVLIEQRWMFNEIYFTLFLYFIKRPTLFCQRLFHHSKVLMKVH